jgi:hypothetical protein
VIAAVVVSVTLGSETGRLAAEVAKWSVGEAPRHSSGEEGSATRKSSSEKESSRYSSGGPVGQRKEEAKELQAVLQQEGEPPNYAVRNPSTGGPANTF